MIIKQASIQEAKTILTDPVIYETITSDNAPPVDQYEPEQALYIGGFMGEIFGLFVFHPKSQILWQTHIQVLPGYRTYSMEFAKKGLEWFWQNTSVLKLCAEIPSKYMNVLNFGLKNGFKIDGRIDNAYLKGGELHSIYYLSLERPHGMG